MKMVALKAQSYLFKRGCHERKYSQVGVVERVRWRNIVLCLFQTFDVDSCFAPLAAAVVPYYCACASMKPPFCMKKWNLRWTTVWLQQRSGWSCSEALRQGVFLSFSCTIATLPPCCPPMHLLFYIMSCILQPHIRPIPLVLFSLPVGVQRFAPGAGFLCRKLMSTNSTSCHSLCSWQLHALKPPLLLPDSFLSFFPPCSLTFKQGYIPLNVMEQLLSIQEHEVQRCRADNLCD